MSRKIISKRIDYVGEICLSYLKRAFYLSCLDRKNKDKICKNRSSYVRTQMKYPDFIHRSQFLSIQRHQNRIFQWSRLGKWPVEKDPFLLKVRSSFSLYKSISIRSIKRSKSRVRIGDQKVFTIVDGRACYVYRHLLAHQNHQGHMPPIDVGSES